MSSSEGIDSKRKKIEQFIQHYIPPEKYSLYQKYSRNFYSIQYWEARRHSDSDRADENIKTLRRQMVGEDILNELFNVRKSMLESQELKGNFFHQLVYLDCNFGMGPANLLEGEFSPQYTEKEYFPIILLLQDLGVDPNSKDSYFGQTALSSAIGWDNHPYALALLNAVEKNQLKIDLDQPCATGRGEIPPLILAISRGNKIIADKLITLGADVNKPDKFGLTPLHWAMIMGDHHTMRSLLENPHIQIQADLEGKFPSDYKDLTLSNLGNQKYLLIQANFWNKPERFLTLRKEKSEAIRNCSQLLNQFVPNKPTDIAKPANAPQLK